MQVVLNFLSNGIKFSQRGGVVQVILNVIEVKDLPETEDYNNQVGKLSHFPD